MHRFSRFSPLPFLLIVLFTLMSCSSPRDNRNLAAIAPQASQDAVLKKLLYTHYRIWQGTPYRKGGLSRQGIDCSGFVFLIYRDLIGMQLPRTTEAQAGIGDEIPFNSLRPGDLLFFKTGWFSYHVGIYLEGSRFLHASSKRGVSISSLSEKYWQDSFYLAKRIDRM